MSGLELSTGASTGPRTGPGRGTPRVLLVAEYYATLARHFWRGNIVTVFVSPVLYLLAMGVGVGTLVDANEGTAIEGTPYLQYVAPGLMAAAAMQSAVNSSTYPVLASVKWLRTAYAAVASPIRPVDLALGLQAWQAVQMFFSSVVFAVIVGIAGAIASPWVIVAPFAAVLGGMAYSTLLAAWSVGRDGEHSFPLIFRLGILPTFLMSGTFFPVSQLPAPLEALAVVSPLWHSVELVRGFTTGDFAAIVAVGHVLVLSAYVGVGLLFCRREYTKRLYS